MTDKQKRFCDEYLIDLNATQAAARAGYSLATARQIGTENLAKPNIQEYLRKRMEEKNHALIASQDEVLGFLTRVMRGEEKDEQLISNAMGELETVEVRRQLNQIRAAEQLLKRYPVADDTAKESALGRLDEVLAEIGGVV